MVCLVAQLLQELQPQVYMQCASAQHKQNLFASGGVFLTAGGFLAVVFGAFFISGSFRTALGTWVMVDVAYG